MSVKRRTEAENAAGKEKVPNARFRDGYRETWSRVSTASQLATKKTCCSAGRGFTPAQLAVEGTLYRRDYPVAEVIDRRYATGKGHQVFYEMVDHRNQGCSAGRDTPGKTERQCKGEFIGTHPPRCQGDGLHQVAYHDPKDDNRKRYILPEHPDHSPADEDIEKPDDDRRSPEDRYGPYAERSPLDLMKHVQDDDNVPVLR